MHWKFALIGSPCMTWLRRRCRWVIINSRNVSCLSLGVCNWNYGRQWRKCKFRIISINRAVQLSKLFETHWRTENHWKKRETWYCGCILLQAFAYCSYYYNYSSSQQYKKVTMCAMLFQNYSAFSYSENNYVH